MKKLPFLLLLLLFSCNFIKETKTISDIADKVGKRNKALISVMTSVTNGHSTVTLTVSAETDNPLFPGKLAFEMVEEMNKRFIRYDEYIIRKEGSAQQLSVTSEQMSLVRAKKKSCESQLRSVANKKLSLLSADFSPQLAQDALASPEFDSLVVPSGMKQFDGFTFAAENGTADRVGLRYSDGEYWLVVVYDTKKDSHTIHGIDFHLKK